MSIVLSVAGFASADGDAYARNPNPPAEYDFCSPGYYVCYEWCDYPYFGIVVYVNGRPHFHCTI